MVSTGHIVIVVIVVVSVVGVLALIAALLKLLGKRANGIAPSDAPEVPGARYVVRSSVLSPGERALWPVLNEALRVLAAERNLPVPLVLPSVRLAEVLEVDKASMTNRSRSVTAFNRIQSKQVDFVVCRPVDTRPMLIVELDDRTHQRQDRRERDAFVDTACAAAGLPILHVVAGEKHDAHRLAAQIAGKLGVHPQK